jgi:biotin synthase
MKTLIDTLNSKKRLSHKNWLRLLSSYQPEDVQYAAELARGLSQKQFGTAIYFRGIIEFTNYCKNDCYYCGLRCSAKSTIRYRLTKEQILGCCQDGYALGYQTFVLQGGEDPYYTDERVCELVHSIKKTFPDVAVTLSLGERSRESFQSMFDAGADRYLLRHETAAKPHYEKLHPQSMSFDHRNELPAGAEGNRVPNGLRHDGWVTLSDHGQPGRGYAVHRGFSTAYDRHWPVSPTP